MLGAENFTDVVCMCVCVRAMCIRVFLCVDVGQEAGKWSLQEVMLSIFTLTDYGMKVTFKMFPLMTGNTVGRHTTQCTAHQGHY